MTIKRKKVKSIDVALKAGVSQPTVSRALRNSALVSKETRDRILKVAKELNYQVDSRASKLRSNRTNTLALLIDQDPVHMIDPFFHRLLSHITQEANKQGYDLLVSFQQYSENWVADYEISRKADGIIFLGYRAYQTHLERLSQLKESAMNFVTFGPEVSSEQKHFLSCDNHMGGCLVANHLIQLGHRHIGFVGSISADHPEFIERYQGLQSVIASNPDAQVSLAASISTEESGYYAAKRILNENKNITALFCASDIIAIGAYLAIKEMGFSIPQDIAVVGFDNLNRSSYISPALTTVDQNVPYLAERLVGSIIAQIDGANPERSHSIEPRLVVRGST